MPAYESTKQGTREKIIGAFWELYKTTNIEKITVKNITDESGIYRTTFYLHFSDVYAVLEAIEEMLLSRLRAVRTDMGTEECMKELRCVIKMDYEYLRTILDKEQHQAFASVYENMLAEKICRGYHISGEEMGNKALFVIHKTIHFLRELIFECVDSHLLTGDEMMQIMNGYLREGIIPVLKKQTEK